VTLEGMDLGTWNFLEVILTSNRTKRNQSFERRRKKDEK
jgi:hypothetical protein